VAGDGSRDKQVTNLSSSFPPFTGQKISIKTVSYNNGAENMRGRTAEKIKAISNNIFPRLVKLRRDFHQYPELGFK